MAKSHILYVKQLNWGIKVKQLVFNADDFGLSPEINEAILELAEKKALTSTTVMANLVQPKDIERLKSSNIGIGLHLNLSDGKPISNVNQVKSLVNKSGNFKKWPDLLIGFLMGRVKKKHIEKEIIAQLEKLKSYHIEISHADSHKHLHQFPVLGPFILKIFKEQGIKKMRNCMPTHTNNLQMKILRVFSLSSRHALKGFIKPDALFSYFSAFPQEEYDNFSQSLKAMLQRYDRIEVMTHPGLENTKGSYLGKKKEFDFLKDFSQQIRTLIPDAQIISYNELEAGKQN